MITGELRNKIDGIWDIFWSQDIPFYLPAIDRQHEFASFVEQVDKSKFVIQKSLDKLETLKKY